MGAELRECLVGNGVDAPSVTCSCKNAGGFEHGEREVDDSSVSEWVISGHGDMLNFPESFPQDFNGVFRGSDGGNAGMVAFKLSPCDGAIGGAQVCEHCVNSDISKAKDIVIKSGKINAVNGSKDLFFHFLLDGSGSGEFLEGGFIEVCGFSTGSSIGASCMYGGWPRVCR